MRERASEWKNLKNKIQKFIYANDMGLVEFETITQTAMIMTQIIK